MRFENAKDLVEMRQMKKEAREAILEKVCCLFVFRFLCCN